MSPEYVAVIVTFPRVVPAVYVTWQVPPERVHVAPGLLQDPPAPPSSKVMLPVGKGAPEATFETVTVQSVVPTVLTIVSNVHDSVTVTESWVTVSGPGPWLPEWSASPAYAAVSV